MPLHFRENQYWGVNAHLHSYFQQHTGWAGFHGQHLVDLLRALQSLLPPESGDVVNNEPSLQISHYNPIDDRLTRSWTKPDIAVFKPGAESIPMVNSSSQPATPTASLPVAVTMTEAEDIGSIVIYRVEDDEIIAKPVTRIELLSPANKPPRSHYPFYIQKRSETLASGVKLVEIDYLHELRSPVLALPSYPARQANAYPYSILVSDPTPSIREGETDVYSFRVDDPIPAIPVPLAGDEHVTLDLNRVYHTTCAANIRYGLYTVDYASLPESFDTYDDTDQQRIKARMAAAAEYAGKAAPPIDPQ